MDGGQFDLDFGHYERFSNVNYTQDSSWTGGRLSKLILELNQVTEGKTLRLSDLSKAFQDKVFAFCNDKNLLIEIGGNVAEDNEGTAWIHLLKDLANKFDEVTHIHMVPLLKDFAGEIKSKNIQTSLQNMEKIIPVDLVILRSSGKLSKEEVGYLNSKLIGTRWESLPNLNEIYEIPSYLTKFSYLSSRFNLSLPNHIKSYLQLVKKVKGEVKVLLRNKYLGSDAYFSLVEAIRLEFNHLGYKLKLTISRDLPTDLNEYDGYVFPGGFGSNEWESIVKDAARIISSGKPCLGICWGMQALTVALIKLNNYEADSEENSKNPPYLFTKNPYGICLGKRVITLNKELVEVRFRNNYSLNNDFVPILERLNVRLDGKIKGDAITTPSAVQFNNVWAYQFHAEFEVKPSVSFPNWKGWFDQVILSSNKRVTS